MADCGVEAVQLMMERPKRFYDVVLLDVDLPIMDGFELCERIHSFVWGSCLSSLMSVDVNRAAQKSAVVHEEAKEVFDGDGNSSQCNKNLL